MKKRQHAARGIEKRRSEGLSFNIHRSGQKGIMGNNMLKTNILSIVITGRLMVLSGGILCIFKEVFVSHIRYLQPIPPLSVVADVTICDRSHRH